MADPIYHLSLDRSVTSISPETSVVLFYLMNVTEQPEDTAQSASVDNDDQVINVVLDTSVFLSYINPDDPHHITVSSALGAIQPYKPRVCLPAIVLLEGMGKLIKRRGCSVSEAQKLMAKGMKNFSVWHEKPRLDKERILEHYKVYAKSNLHTLSGTDFYIVVEAISLDAYLLTCDIEMNEKSKKRHKKTYLLATGKSELPKLLKSLGG